MIMYDYIKSWLGDYNMSSTHPMLEHGNDYVRLLNVLTKRLQHAHSTHHVASWRWPVSAAAWCCRWSDCRPCGCTWTASLRGARTPTAEPAIENRVHLQCTASYPISHRDMQEDNDILLIQRISRKATYFKMQCGNLYWIKKSILQSLWYI